MAAVRLLDRAHEPVVTPPPTPAPEFEPCRLRAARKAAGYTLAQVADIVDRHWMTIRRYEVGLIDLPASMLAELAALYRVHPGDLFTPRAAGTGPVGTDPAGPGT